MVIIDTSVWIEYFKNNDPYFKEVDRLLRLRQILLPELILAELYYGAFKKEMTRISLLKMATLPIDEQNIILGGSSFAFKEGLRNHGIGLVDAAIIFATIENNAKLWILDKKVIKFLDDQYLFKI